MGRAITFIAFILFALVSDAQILYTDIAPDYFQSTNGDKVIDLNNDLTPDLDFSLTLIDPKFDVWFVLTTGDSTEILIDSAHFNFLQQFDEGMLIPKSGQWKNGQYLAIAYLTSGSPEGVWPGAIDKYFAFRMKQNGKYQYGWMQLSVQDKVNNFTLSSFAYQSTPDIPIHAGEYVKSGLSKLMNQDDFNTTFLNGVLKISSTVAFLETSIISASGIECRHLVGHQKEQSIDLSDFPEGIYVVCIKTNSGYSYRKIGIH